MLFDKFDGCSVGWFSPATISGTICQIAYDFGRDLFEKNKYDLKKLLSFASDLIKELKVAVSHDEMCAVCGVINISLNVVTAKQVSKVE